ncbi:MAG: hypothetical protein IJD14_06460 [Christensenellaceae bacterium]|nr:hypothetical protein [Christensenellaceae bacterium]
MKRIILFVMVIVLMFACIGCSDLNKSELLVKKFCNAIEKGDVEAVKDLYFTEPYMEDVDRETFIDEYINSNLPAEAIGEILYRYADVYKEDWLKAVSFAGVQTAFWEWAKVPGGWDIKEKVFEIEKFEKQEDLENSLKDLRYSLDDGYVVTYEINDDSFIVESDHLALINLCERRGQNNYAVIPQHIKDFYADFESYGTMFFDVTIRSSKNSEKCRYEIEMDVFKKGGNWYIDYIYIADYDLPDEINNEIDLYDYMYADYCEDALYEIAEAYGFEYGKEYAVEISKIYDEI